MHQAEPQTTITLAPGASAAAFLARVRLAAADLREARGGTLVDLAPDPADPLSVVATITAEAGTFGYGPAAGPASYTEQAPDGIASTRLDATMRAPEVAARLAGAADRAGEAARVSAVETNARVLALMAGRRGPSLHALT